VFLDADRSSGAIDVTLEPMPAARYRVVDADGKPVRGARVEHAVNRPLLGQSRDGAQHAKQAVAAWVARSMAHHARSQRDGVLHVPCRTGSRGGRRPAFGRAPERRVCWS
jgi:hypothetical protein